MRPRPVSILAGVVILAGVSGCQRQQGVDVPDVAWNTWVTAMAPNIRESRTLRIQLQVAKMEIDRKGDAGRSVFGDPLKMRTYRRNCEKLLGGYRRVLASIEPCFGPRANQIRKALDDEIYEVQQWLRELPR